MGHLTGSSVGDGGADGRTGDPSYGNVADHIDDILGGPICGNGGDVPSGHDGPNDHGGPNRVRNDHGDANGGGLPSEPVCQQSFLLFRPAFEWLRGRHWPFLQFPEYQPISKQRKWLKSAFSLFLQ